jgi:hypothetical protein
MDSRMGRSELSSVYCTLGFAFKMPTPIGLIFPSFLKAEKPTVGAQCDAEISPSNEVSLENIEENQEFEPELVKRVARVIEGLPSLESLSE